MSKNGVVIHTDDVMPYVCDESYSSRLLMDDSIAGEAAINVNEGTLGKGKKTAGGVHDKGEIYYCVKGRAVLWLNDDSFEFKPGSIAYIPGGVLHWIDNTNGEEEFVLLTFWPDADDNEVYHERMKNWGTSIRYVNPQPQN